MARVDRNPGCQTIGSGCGIVMNFEELANELKPTRLAILQRVAEAHSEGERRDAAAIARYISETLGPADQAGYLAAVADFLDLQRTDS